MIKDLIIMLLFVILVPLLIVLGLLGFRGCWQCHNVFHRFQLRKYHLRMHNCDELVCKECHELLSESR